jgi:hypothetical protein
MSAQVADSVDSGSNQRASGGGKPSGSPASYMIERP